MDFFERQRQTRRKTVVLVAMFAAAVFLTVIAVNAVGYLAAVLFSDDAAIFAPMRWMAQPYWLFITCGTVAAIAIGSLRRIWSLGDGGKTVARMAGGRRITPGGDDPDEQRLVNVVEEMSIASGIPVPRIYVMDDEDGINAFVAGYSPSEAVLVVTRGALVELSRDELQGVAGHEFSHIFNGDMRMNVTLIGILAGILVVGQSGEVMLRTIRTAGWAVGRGLILVEFAASIVAGALIGVGYAGIFFGRLIKAAVSRQRELLADASSVQYTRNPAGLVGALLKIRQGAWGSRLKGRHAEELSHLCFGQPLNISLGNLLATHPPIEERILALDPGIDLDKPGQYISPAPERPDLPEPALEFLVTPGKKVALGASGLTGLVGNPTPEHTDYAAGLYAFIPPEVLKALRDPRGAKWVVYTLLLPPDAAKEDAAIKMITETEGDDFIGLAVDYRERLQGLGPQVALPLVDLAVPALRKLPAEGIRTFLDAAKRLIGLDKAVSLFEFTLLALLRKYLYSRAGEDVKVKYGSLPPLLPEIRFLLSAVACQGAGKNVETAEAYERGMSGLGLEPGTRPPFTEASIPELDAALRKFAMLTPRLKKSLLDACAECVQYDNRVTVAEGELLRAISASLDCPMPPLLN